MIPGFLEACAAVPDLFPGAYEWQKVTSVICALQLNDGIHELHLDSANTKKWSGIETSQTLYNPGEDKKPSDPPASGN